MKIAGVSIWIWLLGIAVLMTGTWGVTEIKKQPTAPAKIETTPAPPRVLPVAPKPMEVEVVKPPVRRPVEIELDRLRLVALKREVEWRDITAKMRANGREPRSRIVRDMEMEAMSNDELAATIKKLEAEVVKMPPTAGAP